MSERFPAIPMPTGTLESQRATLLALKEALEMLTGQRGTDASRSASASSLVSALTSGLDTKVSKAGDTMTGLLTLSGDPSTALQAATKQYTDTQRDTRVAKAGDTMTGLLTLSGAPTVALHAATKGYVDTEVATKGALPTNTAGVAGAVFLINPPAATGFSLPAGGSWLSWRTQFNASNGTYPFVHQFSVSAGGTFYGAPSSPFAWVGWAWRIV